MCIYLELRIDVNLVNRIGDQNEEAMAGNCPALIKL